MRYVYDFYTVAEQRYSTTTNIDAVTATAFRGGGYVLITDELVKHSKPVKITHVSELEDWRNARERDHAWKPEVLEPIKAVFMPQVDRLSEEALQEIVDKFDKKREKDHINPTHYKSFLSGLGVDLQWLEAAQLLPHMRNPECFKAAVELQIRKYLDRNGGKDHELQEMQKALWYMAFLVAYIKNGNKPILVKDINSILNG